MVIACVVLTVMLQGIAAAQDQPFRADLEASIVSSSFPYDVVGRTESLVFRGGVLELQIRAVNRFPRDAEGREMSAAVEWDWPHRVRLRLAAGDVRGTRQDIGAVPCTPRKGFEVALGAAHPEPRMLAGGTVLTWNCTVPQGVLQRLDEGLYTISAQWDSDEIAKSMLRRHGRNRLPSLSSFELREARSVIEKLNMNAQWLSWTIREEEFGSALQFADGMLAIGPTTTEAIIGRGLANAALKRCAEARVDFDRAAMTVTNGTDPNARPTRENPEDVARRLSAHADACR
jgi:hypothetical protein